MLCWENKREKRLGRASHSGWASCGRLPRFRTGRRRRLDLMNKNTDTQSGCGRGRDASLQGRAQDPVDDQGRDHKEGCSGTPASKTELGTWDLRAQANSTLKCNGPAGLGESKRTHSAHTARRARATGRRRTPGRRVHQHQHQHQRQRQHQHQGEGFQVRGVSSSQGRDQKGGCECHLAAEPSQRALE